MRNFIYGLTVLFFLLSCSQEHSFDAKEIDFKRELMALSNEPLELFYVTRAGVAEFSLDALNVLTEKAIVLSKKYDIDKKVIESGYYSKADVNLLDSEINTDVICNFIKENSTDEFQKMLYNIVMEGQIVDVETIINNIFLLPNEQIALVILNNIVGNNSLNCRTVSLSDCRNNYNDNMSVCKNWLYVGTGLTVVTAVASCGTLSTLFAVATTLDYERCSSGAMESYMTCVESVK